MCGVSMQCFGATMRNITEQRGQANSGDGDAECDQRFVMHAEFVDDRMRKNMACAIVCTMLSIGWRPWRQIQFLTRDVGNK